MKKCLFFYLIGLIVFNLGATCQAENQHRTITFPLPGQSGASSLLQKDALSMVMAAASITDRTCKPKTWDDIYVTDTQISRRPQLLGYKNGQPLVTPWEETWTVNVCGKLVSIPITFIPDADPNRGTTFKVSIPK